MRARRLTTAAALAGLLSFLAVGVAHAADEPALTTPGAPVVVANEPHRLTLTWTPSTWAGEPAGDAPIIHEVRAKLGPNVYRSLGTTTGTSITLTTVAPGSEYQLTIGAYTNNGYSHDSPVTPVRTAYGLAKVSYLNLDWSATDNQIQHALQVVNTGTAPLDLTVVQVRYHLTFEGGNTSLVANCDWAAIGCDTITPTIQFFPPPLPPGGPTTSPRPPSPSSTVYPPPGTPVPGWIELRFTAGTLAPGTSTGPIFLRHHRHDWTAIDERDDRSWQQATGRWVDNTRITLDVDGVREFGDTYS